MRIRPRAAARVLRRECVAERVAHALGRVLERLELLHHRQRIERRGRPGLDVGDPFFEVRCRLRATGDAAPAGAEHEGQAYRERAADEVVRHKSEEHTSELQSLMRTSYAVFSTKNKKKPITQMHAYQ